MSCRGYANLRGALSQLFHNVRNDVTVRHAVERDIRRLTTQDEHQIPGTAQLARLSPTAMHYALYPFTVQSAELSLDLFAAHDLHTALQRVVHSALRILEGADFSSLTLLQGGGMSTPAFTDSTAVELDHFQYRCQEGPWVDATRTPGVGLTFCHALAANSPWPTFAAHAIDRGIHGVLSVALFPTAEAPRLGALNLYARDPHTLHAADHNLAILLAAYAGAALAAVNALETVEEHAEYLSNTMEDREVIGQAKGILMYRYTLDSQAAFDLLSAAAETLNIKIRDLAHALTEDPAMPLPSPHKRRP